MDYFSSWVPFLDRNDLAWGGTPGALALLALWLARLGQDGRLRLTVQARQFPPS